MCVCDPKRVYGSYTIYLDRDFSRTGVPVWELIWSPRKVDLVSLPRLSESFGVRRQLCGGLSPLKTISKTNPSAPPKP